MRKAPWCGPGGLAISWWSTCSTRLWPRVRRRCWRQRRHQCPKHRASSLLARLRPRHPRLRQPPLFRRRPLFRHHPFRRSRVLRQWRCMCPQMHPRCRQRHRLERRAALLPAQPWPSPPYPRLPPPFRHRLRRRQSLSQKQPQHRRPRPRPLHPRRRQPPRPEQRAPLLPAHPVHSLLHLRLPPPLRNCPLSRCNPLRKHRPLGRLAERAPVAIAGRIPRPSALPGVRRAVWDLVRLPPRQAHPRAVRLKRAAVLASAMQQARL